MGGGLKSASGRDSSLPKLFINLSKNVLDKVFMYWEGFMQCCEWVWLNTLYQEAVNNYIIPFPYDSSAIELITPTLKSDSIKMPQLEASTAGEFYTYLFWEQVFEPPNAMCRTGPVVSVALQGGCIIMSYLFHSDPHPNNHETHREMNIFFLTGPGRAWKGLNKIWFWRTWAW